MIWLPGVNGNISLDAYPFTKIIYENNYITQQPSAGISSLANPLFIDTQEYTPNYKENAQAYLKERVLTSISYLMENHKAQRSTTSCQVRS